MKSLSIAEDFLPRIKFMLIDIIELRENKVMAGWHLLFSSYCISITYFIIRVQVQIWHVALSIQYFKILFFFKYFNNIACSTCTVSLREKKWQKELIVC